MPSLGKPVDEQEQREGLVSLLIFFSVLIKLSLVRRLERRGAKEEGRTGVNTELGFEVGDIGHGE